MLELQDLSLRVDAKTHLDQVSIRFEPGQLTTLLGRTGAGKTTVMRMIAGLVTPDAGRITMAGQDWRQLAPWQRPVAMVTQQFINYPHLSVLDNVTFPLLRQGIVREVANETARDMLSKLGLGAMITRRPGQLSGGQQQRVAIARALVKKAPVLLLDEPFVNLDYKLREDLREELVELLAGARDTTVIYASTDPREALSMSGAVILMAEGRMLQADDPKTVYDQPATVDAARVVNDPPMNLIPMQVGDKGIILDRLTRFPPDAFGFNLLPGTYTLGLRAHALMQGGDIPARVLLTEVYGSETVTHLDAQGHKLVMLERTVASHAIGETIHLSCDLSRALIYDHKGDLFVKEQGNG